MKRIANLISLMLACLLMLTACNSPSEEEKRLQELKAEATKYSFLIAGRNACYSLTGMLGYYNNITYQKAKETAKISDSLRAEYFPTVNWQGAEVLTQKQTCTVSDLMLSDYTKREVTYMVCYSISDGFYLPTDYWYSATYSIKSDEITKLELICSY